MTLLCADIGNSHTVLGLLRDGDVLDHWRVATDERRTSDEWAVLIRGLLADSTVADGLAGISVCATVPAVLHEWRDMLRSHFGAVPNVVVEPGVRTGVPVLMDNPREVGADRIINALAAAQMYDGPCIVVDFGTATTFDVVSPRGEYIGGAIAPGIDISLEALGRRGAQLRKVEVLRPRHVIAKNTVEALQSGIVFGFASQVDGIVARMVGELGVAASEVNVVATGGLAPVVVDECAMLHRPPALADPARAGDRSSSATSRTPGPRYPFAARRRRSIGWPTMSEHPDDDLPEQIRVRREKRQRLLDDGQAAYPLAVPRTHTLREIRETYDGRELEPDTHTGTVVSVTGRVIHQRNTGKLCFARLREGDGTELQVMLSLADVGEERLAAYKALVDIGDLVGVTGEVVTSRRGELSVQATAWTMAAKALRPLPNEHSRAVRRGPRAAALRRHDRASRRPATWCAPRPRCCARCGPRSTVRGTSRSRRRPSSSPTAALPPARSAPTSTRSTRRCCSGSRSSWT